MRPDSGAYATEFVAAKIGDAVGGPLNAAPGNLAGLVIALAARQAGEYTLVKASIAGAIVTNTPFMLAFAMRLYLLPPRLGDAHGLRPTGPDDRTRRADPLDREPRLEWTGPQGAHVRASARHMFFRHRDKDCSFTDGTSFVMQELKLRTVLTTDTHVRQGGFDVVAGPDRKRIRRG